MNFDLADQSNGKKRMKLILLEKQLIDIAARFNLTMKSAPAKTYLHLESSPESLFNYVIDSAQKILGVFRVCLSEDIDPWDDGEFFRLSMKGMGITFPSDFLDHITSGDVIEGYDFDRKQVFRNMAFMQNSGYSLIEMLANEWPALFDRSKMVTDQMIAYCDDILWKANKTIPFNIPVHYVRERESSERLLWEISFRYLSPLFSGPDKPFGILGTFRLKPVELNSPIERISFI